MSEGFIGATVGGLPTWTFVWAGTTTVARFELEGFPETTALFPTEEAARAFDARPELGVVRVPNDGTLRKVLLEVQRQGGQHVGLDPVRNDPGPILPIAVVIDAADDPDRPRGGAGDDHSR